MFQRLVGSCGEVQAAPTEIEEIQFLCTVCAKIKADPYLVNFFLEVGYDIVYTCFRCLILSVLQSKTDTNSVDPDEPSHLDLHCLTFCFLILD